MQIIVIVLNVILASGCLILARRLWLFRLAFKRSTHILEVMELAVHQTLKDAPDLIGRGQLTIQQWHTLLAQMRLVTQHALFILRWVNLSQRLGIRVWRQSRLIFPRDRFSSVRRR